MKITAYILITLALYSLLAEITITFKPFKISFNAPYYAIGWICICIGIGFISFHSKQKGVKQGMDLVVSAIKELNEETTNK